MGEFINVANKKDVLAGKAISVNAKGKDIALFNVDGKFYAVDNECTHAGAPLCEGTINGTTVTCPWHGAEFNLSDGQVLAAPACDPIKSYKVMIDGDDIKIEV